MEAAARAMQDCKGQELPQKYERGNGHPVPAVPRDAVADSGWLQAGGGQERVRMRGREGGGGHSSIDRCNRVVHSATLIHIVARMDVPRDGDLPMDGAVPPRRWLTSAPGFLTVVPLLNFSRSAFG